jgi:hypothetical protein
LAAHHRPFQKEFEYGVTAAKQNTPAISAARAARKVLTRRGLFLQTCSFFGMVELPQVDRTTNGRHPSVFCFDVFQNAGIYPSPG